MPKKKTIFEGEWEIKNTYKFNHVNAFNWLAITQNLTYILASITFRRPILVYVKFVFSRSRQWFAISRILKTGVLQMREELLIETEISETL